MTSDDRLREIRERLAVATVASCNCGVKTFQAEYHESTCRYRVLEEADDLLMHMQRQIIGLTEQLMDAEGERDALQARVAEQENAARHWSQKWARMGAEAEALVGRLSAAEAERDSLATRLLKRVERCCEPDGTPDGAFSYCERCKADLDAIPARAALKGPTHDR